MGSSRIPYRGLGQLSHAFRENLKPLGETKRGLCHRDCKEIPICLYMEYKVSGVARCQDFYLVPSYEYCVVLFVTVIRQGRYFPSECFLWNRVCMLICWYANSIFSAQTVNLRNQMLSRNEPNLIHYACKQIVKYEMIEVYNVY